MRYDHPELREKLTAAYVLGTLRGAARKRYESLMHNRRDWQTSHAWWLNRIHLLADTAPAVSPSPKVWKAIQARVYGSVNQAVKWWKNLALVSSALSLGLAVLTVNLLLQTPAQQAPTPITMPSVEVALLNNEQSQAGWVLSLVKGSNGLAEIKVVTTSNVKPIDQKSFELWVLPADKSAPISLGLLPENGTQQLHIKQALLALMTSGGLAVSLEPKGGSPTGQPTGAVLYQGKLASI